MRNTVSDATVAEPGCLPIARGRHRIVDGPAEEVKQQLATRKLQTELVLDEHSVIGDSRFLVMYPRLLNK